MIPIENRVRFILTELYNKICNCIRNDSDKEDLLNPYFHNDECLYKLAVEKENIEWKKDEQTQES